MKKVASLVGAGAILLSMTGFVFARGGHHHSSDDTTIRNYARVTNDVEVEAETGDNEVGGMMVWGGRIRTGFAEAWGTLTNRVNWNNVDCDCADGDVTVSNRAMVRNDIEVEAETGDNEIHGMFVKGGRIRSGGAYADGLVENVVNTNIVGD